MLETTTTTTTPQINNLIGWMRQKNRATSAARILVLTFWRGLSNDDVKFSYLRFRRQCESAAENLFYSPPLHEKPSCQASDCTLRLFRATSPIWNNRKTLNIKQSFIFMWRFSCSRRRGFQPRSQGLCLLRSRERTLGTRLRSFWHSILIIGRRWNSWNRLRNSGDGNLVRNSRRN